MIARKLVPLVLLLVLVACGGQNKRVETLKATLVVVNQARDGFLKFDTNAQTVIVETAVSREKAVERLTLYRKHAALIVDAFVLAYQAIATAATLEDDDASITSMLLAVKTLGEQIVQFQKDYAP